MEIEIRYMKHHSSVYGFVIHQDDQNYYLVGGNGKLRHHFCYHHITERKKNC